MDSGSIKSYKFGPFSFDSERGYLYDADGQEVELTATPKKILEYILKSTALKGKDWLFTRDELIKGVWEDHGNIENATVDKHIATLRKAFGRGERDQSVIQTVHREGYRFKLSVMPAPEEPNATTITSQSVRNPDQLESQALDRTAIRGGTTEEEGVQESTRRAGSFVPWVFGRGGGVLSLLLLLLVAVTVALSFWNRLCPPLAQTIASFSQFIIILGVFLHSCWNKPRYLSLNPSPLDVAAAGYNSLDEYTAERPVLQKALSVFMTYWRLLLVSWVPLYLVYSWETWNIDCAANKTSQLASILEAVFNMGNTVMVILCYEVLNKELGRQPRREFGAASIGLALLGIIPLLALSRILTAEQGLAAFTLLAGLAAGIYMALFVARLQSKFLDPAPLLVVALFSYTAIQPLALYIQNYKALAWIVLDYALILKCLLYLYVLWLLKSGDLLFYFREVKRTYDDRVDFRRRAYRKLIE